MITIYLDNSNNASTVNVTTSNAVTTCIGVPGYNKWVGGDAPNKGVGIKVLKTNTHLAYEIDEDTLHISTWYYDYGWCSDETLDGPFTDKERITLGVISREKLCCTEVEEED